MQHEIRVTITDGLGITNGYTVLLLPTPDWKIASAMEETQIPGIDRCEIVEWSCRMRFLTELFDNEDILSGGENIINELNFLAGRLSKMSDYERALFEGSVKIRGISDLKGLINFTYNLQQPYLMPGIRTVKDLGEDYIKNNAQKIPIELSKYISADAAGQYIQAQHEGAFTDAGYVVDPTSDMDGFWHAYDGKTLPNVSDLYNCFFCLTLASAEAYKKAGTDAPTVILKLPEPGYSDEAERLACISLGVQSLDDCVIVKRECFDPFLEGILDGSPLSKVYAFTAELYELEVYGNEYGVFLAALESYQMEKPDFRTAKEALTRIDDFVIRGSIESAEDYGRKCLEAEYPREEYSVAVSAIDLKAYGEDNMREDNAVLTSQGIVIRPADLEPQEQAQAQVFGDITDISM